MKLNNASYLPSTSEAVCQGKLYRCLKSITAGVLLLLILLPNIVKAQSPCVDDILPLQSTLPLGGVSSLGWTQTTGSTTYHGCTVVFSYCWRLVNGYPANSETYQTRLLSVIIIGGCGSDQGLFDAVEEALQQTSKTNHEGLPPCTYKTVKSEMYRNCCWQLEWVDGVGTHNESWTPCAYQPARCVITCDICYYVSGSHFVVTSNNCTTTLEGTPTCGALPGRTLTKIDDDGHCYLVDCANPNP